jgi:CxxC-x17-CxxC domain-containing protein
MTYADQDLICADCGTQFLFTAFEHEFYVRNNFTYEIEQCPACRRARKAPSRPVFLRPSHVLPAVRSMRDAPCMVCGTTIAVSFAPRFGKPIYCAECYERYGSRYGSRAPNRVPRVDQSTTATDPIAIMGHRTDISTATVCPDRAAADARVNPWASPAMEAANAEPAE